MPPLDVVIAHRSPLFRLEAQRVRKLLDRCVLIQASDLAGAGYPKPGNLCERVGTTIAVVMSRTTKVAARTLTHDRIDSKQEPSAHACSSRRTARGVSVLGGIQAVALGSAIGGAFSQSNFSSNGFASLRRSDHT